jgi:hypothetical protein
MIADVLQRWLLSVRSFLRPARVDRRHWVEPANAVTRAVYGPLPAAGTLVPALEPLPEAAPSLGEVEAPLLPGPATLEEQPPARDRPGRAA